jgi:hypothetical protein
MTNVARSMFFHPEVREKRKDLDKPGVAGQIG